MNRDTMMTAAIVIALVALGGNFFVIYQDSNQINQNKVSLTNQIDAMQSSLSGLQSNVDSLETQLTQSQGTVASQAQQIVSVQTSIKGLQTQLSTLLTDLNSNISDSIAFQAMAISELRGFNSSLTALTQRLDAIAPAVPLMTLVIVSETYNSSSATFNLSVKNNLDVTVYAQIDAILYGLSNYPCDGSAGTYTSQLYQFQGNSTTSTQLILSKGIYSGCGTSPLTSVELDYEAGQSIRVSQVYTFDVVPPYGFIGGGVAPPSG